MNTPEKEVLVSGIDLKILKPYPLAVLRYLQENGQANIKLLTDDLPAIGQKRLNQSEVSKAIKELVNAGVVEMVSSTGGAWSINTYAVCSVEPIKAIIKELRSLTQEKKPARGKKMVAA
jgi:hypothetical protein